MASIASGISAWLAAAGAGTAAATAGGYVATAALAAGALAGASSLMTPDVPDAPDPVGTDKTLQQPEEELQAAELGSVRAKAKKTAKASFIQDKAPATSGVNAPGNQAGVSL